MVRLCWGKCARCQGLEGELKQTQAQLEQAEHLIATLEAEQETTKAALRTLADDAVESWRASMAEVTL